MTHLSSVPMSTQVRPTRAGLPVLRASLHSQLVASNLEMADQALGYPSGSPAHRYSQLAEESIGRLDPARVERPGLSPAMRHSRARFAFRRAVVVYEQILGGRQVDPDEADEQTEPEVA